MLRPRPLDSRLRGNDGLWVSLSRLNATQGGLSDSFLHAHVRKRILVSPVRHIIEEDETHLIETIVRF